MEKILDILNMHFKLSFAFGPFSSHFAMKREERREKAMTEVVCQFI